MQAWADLGDQQVRPHVGPVRPCVVLHPGTQRVMTEPHLGDQQVQAWGAPGPPAGECPCGPVGSVCCHSWNSASDDRASPGRPACAGLGRTQGTSRCVFVWATRTSVLSHSGTQRVVTKPHLEDQQVHSKQKKTRSTLTVLWFGNPRLSLPCLL